MYQKQYETRKKLLTINDIGERFLYVKRTQRRRLNKRHGIVHLKNRNKIVREHNIRFLMYMCLKIEMTVLYLRSLWLRPCLQSAARLDRPCFLQAFELCSDRPDDSAHYSTFVYSGTTCSW